MSILSAYLDPKTALDLSASNARNPIVSDWLASRITSFNRAPDDKEEVAADVAEVDRMRREITSAIDKLEIAISAILVARQKEEEQARRWIMIVGIVLVLLVIGSAVAPFISSAAGTSWVSTLMSGLSVAGLLYLLYSPVHKLIDLARERAGLMTLPSAFRIRVLAAGSKDDLAKIAQGLFDLLQRPTFVQEK